MHYAPLPPDFKRFADMSIAADYGEHQVIAASVTV